MIFMPLVFSFTPLLVFLLSKKKNNLSDAANHH